MTGGFDANGVLANGGIPAPAQYDAQVVTFRFATAAFCTGSADNPAHAWIDGRVTTPLTLDRSISDGRGDIGGYALVNWGAIELDNLDGVLDTLMEDFPVDGRAVRVKVGRVSRNRDGSRVVPSLSEFQTVFDGQSVGWEQDNGIARLRIRDQGYRLDVPLQTSRYAGTGGLEGGSDLTGKPRPILYGYCAHVMPVYLGVIGGKHTYDIGPVESVVAVYEGGAPLALTGGVPGIGQYAVDLSTGIIAYGSSAPSLPITVTARGRQYTTETIIKDVLRTRAGVTYTDFNVENVAEVGIWITDDVTCAELIERLARGIGAYAGFDVAGRFRVGVFKAASESPSYRLDEKHLFSVRRLPDPYDTPPYRRRVIWGRAWTTFSVEQFAGAVSAADRQFLSQPYRIAAAVNSTIQAQRLLQTDPDPVESFFRYEADALAEAQRLVDLYANGRRYQVEVEAQPLLFDVGYCVQVTSDEHADLRSGKLLRPTVVSMQTQDGQVATTLELFG